MLGSCRLLPSPGEPGTGSVGSGCTLGKEGGSGSSSWVPTPVPTAEMAPQSSLQARQTGSEEGLPLTLQGAFPSSAPRKSSANAGTGALTTSRSPGALPPPLLGVGASFLPLQRPGQALQALPVKPLDGAVGKQWEGDSLAWRGIAERLKKAPDAGGRESHFPSSTPWSRCRMCP